MIDPTEIKNKIVSLLEENGVDFKIYQHDPILSYEDAEKMQQKFGWEGTEGKSLVLKVDDNFIVYVTIQGKKVNFNAIKEGVGSKKVRLASAEELQEYFGAVPGCAYPFGFDEKYAIYVDPEVFEQEWLVFSPALPTFTVQAKGEDLRKIFEGLQNNMVVTRKFDQAVV